jgi:hypothetical protein
MVLIFSILALVLFILAAIGHGQFGRVNVLAAGLACMAAAAVFGRFML